jgi:hypothetical protein
MSNKNTKLSKTEAAKFISRLIIKTLTRMISK